MRLLLDVRFVPGRSWVEQVHELLRAIPGVGRVQVFREVRQAEVELADGDPALQQAVLARLEDAGFEVRASPVPDPDAATDYARYYHAAPESSEARWVD